MDPTLRAILAGVGGGANALYSHRRYVHEDQEQEEQRKIENQRAADSLALQRQNMEMLGKHYAALEAAAEKDREERAKAGKLAQFNKVMDNERDNYTRMGVMPSYGALSASVINPSVQSIGDLGEFNIARNALKNVVNNNSLNSDEITYALQNAQKTRTAQALPHGKGFVNPDYQKLALEDSRGAAIAQRRDAKNLAYLQFKSGQFENELKAAEQYADAAFNKSQSGQQLLQYQQMDLTNDPAAKLKLQQLIEMRDENRADARMRAEGRWLQQFQLEHGTDWPTFTKTVMGQRVPQGTGFSFREWMKSNNPYGQPDDDADPGDADDQTLDTPAPKPVIINPYYGNRK